MSDIHSKSHRLYTVQDLLSWQPPPATRLIHSGILNINNRMLIFGDEGSSKSILALHTAHTLSRGSQWLGFMTSPCNVYRLQVELPMYTDRERIAKYCYSSRTIYLAKHTQQILNSDHADRLEELAKSYSYPSTIINRTEQFIHIDESSGWESLKQDIDNCISFLPPAPLVIILDPLYKMFNRDLNNETDFKPLIDKMDILMADSKVGIAFIIIHHSRKSQTDSTGAVLNLGSQEATGTRAILRYVDTAMQVIPYHNDPTLSRVTAVFTKHRNAEEPLPVIGIKWNRDTLHPQLLYRKAPVYEDTDEIEERGDSLLQQLE